MDFAGAEPDVTTINLVSTPEFGASYTLSGAKAAKSYSGSQVMSLTSGGSNR